MSRKGKPNKFTQSIRDVIEQAFHKAGGRDYLVRVAKTRPDVFLGLVGKVIPTESKLSILASYQAMPIPVEQRDAQPMIAADVASQALLPAIDAEFEPVAPDDWLDAPDVAPLIDHMDDRTHSN